MDVQPGTFVSSLSDALTAWIEATRRQPDDAAEQIVAIDEALAATELQSDDLPLAVPLPAASDQLQALRHCGVPVYGTAQADLPAVQFDHDAVTCVISEDADGRLLLPSPGALLGASSLQLKPLRLWVQQHFHWRAQIASGVWVVYWPTVALFLSTRQVSLGGFLHHGRDRRFSVTLPPLGWQVCEL